jgi:hypothetical protein
MQNGWTERIEELEAENTRLRMLRDAAESRAQGLEVERDAAVKWLEEYKSKTYCAYCGAIFNIDSDASHVSEHIRTCPHHPMRELEAENKRLRAFWEWSRESDKMTFEQYHWIGKEASHEG